MKTMGMRHLALNVKNPQVSKDFYVKYLGMTVEWEPDPDNVYLTSGGQDNLALHKAAGPLQGQNGFLDHMGFILPHPESVDELYKEMRQQGLKIIRPLKIHRDGAKSFYIEDPDGIVIQILYHPPISTTQNLKS